MHLWNTHDRYGLIAQALHWTVAGLFIGSYASVYYRHWFTQPATPPNLGALQLHLAFGLTAAVFISIRVAWKLISAVQPDDVPGGSRLEHAAARAMHVVLYGLMIVMPVTGYIGTGADANVFGLVTIPQFRETPVFAWMSQTFGLSWEALEAPVDAIHLFIGGNLLWILIGLHIGAALFHHLIRRDAVLARMVPGLRGI